VHWEIFVKLMNSGANFVIFLVVNFKAEKYFCFATLFWNISQLNIRTWEVHFWSRLFIFVLQRHSEHFISVVMLRSYAEYCHF